ncbi:MAG: hypothetical protein MJE66_16880 [Proteobacteria bacterium]|nr:hypothetical protein [Pseudomonadota bacterium]
MSDAPEPCDPARATRCAEACRSALYALKRALAHADLDGRQVLLLTGAVIALQNEGGMD